ncbi:MAG: hypothetical protein IBJ09_10065 [Bacteroidia bacterium]|nr:hypothetical protein [Bacteroidia bacterium]
MWNVPEKEENEDLRKEWFEKGEKYAVAVNEMVEFGEKNGWENWQGQEPEDKREHLTTEILQRLRTANLNNSVSDFREQFPPAHVPFIPLLEKKAQSIEQLHFIDAEKIVFLTGTSYQKRKAYLLENDTITELDEKIDAIGKSKQGTVFAIAAAGKISTFDGWEGTLIHEFTLTEMAGIGITDLVPFNDGKKVLLVTSEGIYLVSEDGEKKIHPVPEANEGEDEEDGDNGSELSMENAALSNNNRYIVVGDQDTDHRILDPDGNTVGTVGPQSSYPHFCLFSKDDDQLITNSCHFYNGITIGIDSDKYMGAAVEAYTESEEYTLIDEEMRVYAGLASSDYYILGDAYGYIKAVDKQGNRMWRHFLGSTISGMTISDDGQTLWVGSSSGMLHKLKLSQGHRDTHTIGNGQHYEEFRLLIWKEEPQIWKW